MLRVDLMRPVQFYAYHGTSADRAKKIMETKKFSPLQTRHDHWLGQGSYFYREDQEQAHIWAKNRYQKQPAVIEANISLPYDHYLNLDTTQGIQFLKEHITHLIEEKGMLIEGAEEVLKSAIVACLVFSAINKELKWVIFKTFPVKSRRFDNDESLDRLTFEHRGDLMTFRLQGPQVCVRNNKAIKELSEQTYFQEKHVDNIVIGSKRREKISNDLFRQQ